MHRVHTVRFVLFLLAALAVQLEAAVQAAGPFPVVVLAGLLGAATTLVILTVVLTVLALAGLVPHQQPAMPSEAAETRILIWQRNPDAAGHARSRAPGVALSVA